MNVCWTWRTLSLLFLIFSPVFSFPLCIGRICPTCQLLLTAKDASYPAEEDDSLSGTSSRQRGRIRPLRRGNQLSTRAKELEEKSQKNIKRREIAQQDPNLLVDMLFSEVVSAPTNRALQEQMGVDRMTLVQGRTFALARDGESLLVRARVGTGKTLGFLVPAVERLVSLEPSQFQPGRDIGVVIIAPTVELCRQIADTARDLVSFHPNMSVRAVYGGTSIQRDVRTLEQSIPSIFAPPKMRGFDEGRCLIFSVGRKCLSWTKLTFLLWASAKIFERSFRICQESVKPCYFLLPFQRGYGSSCLKYA